MNRKSELKARIRAVARAMRERWNPIGFDDYLPEDEYDSYAPVVVGMFERGDSDQHVAEHLSRLESDAMGLSPRRPETLLAIVRALRVSSREDG
jgi:hypothetical protein